MANHLKLFETQSDYELAKEAGGLKKPRVDYIEESKDVIYTPLTATGFMDLVESIVWYNDTEIKSEITRYNDSAFYYENWGSSNGTSVELIFKDNFNISSINIHFFI